MKQIHQRTSLFAALCGVVLVCACMQGCSMRYMGNRVDDFVEIAEVSIGWGIYGKGIYTPHLLVSVQATRLGHLAVGNVLASRIGLYGGEWHDWTSSGAALPMAPFHYYARGSVPQGEDFWKEDISDRWDRLLGLPSYYRHIWSNDILHAEVAMTMNSPAHWFDLAVEAVPLLPAARVGFSPGEFVDFLLGIVGVDLAGDDQLPEERVEAHLQKLLDKANSGGRIARRRALRAAHQYRRHEIALAILRAACAWDDVRDRGMAFYLLTYGGWSNADKAVVLIPLMYDSDPRMRRYAVGALGNTGEIGEPSIPLLIAILDGKQRDDERGLAASVLGDLAPHASPARKDAAVTAIGRHMIDPAYNVRLSCQIALKFLGRKAEAAIPGMIAALKLENTDERLVAIELLRNLGTKAQVALPALEKLRSDPNALICFNAELCIKRISP